MKLLGVTAAAATTNSTVGAATAVYVYATAAHVISVVDNTGTAGQSDGVVVGTMTVPSGWTGTIAKGADEFIKGNNTSAHYTKISSAGY
jgi:hypothetical protein